ncbi:hypothetical protein DID88_009437 [Monilinia fructigena]|uniref:Uncharacterized protein n=1 Tax=Monilinia fructigena TaxID=38457 RepID=A0A395IMB9_9HELO|nr:hypothetical protein DID88_009437 [Monilinia fructigena]
MSTPSSASSSRSTSPELQSQSNLCKSFVRRNNTHNCPRRRHNLKPRSTSLHPHILSIFYSPSRTRWNDIYHHLQLSFPIILLVTQRSTSLGP